MNKRNSVVAPKLIKVEDFSDKSNRTLTVGLTGSISGNRVEVMHVYFRDEFINVFCYFISEDERFLGSKRFQVTQVLSEKLVPANGAAWNTTDAEFARMLESNGTPLRLIPIDVCGKKVESPVSEKDGVYFAQVPGLTCKQHEPQLIF